MSSDLFFENKKYIPVKDASALTGYTKDYIGQLCRANKVLSKRIGRTWYVEEESILGYSTTPTTFDFSQNLKNQIAKSVTAVPKKITSPKSSETKSVKSSIVLSVKTPQFASSKFLKNIPVGTLHEALFSEGSFLSKKVIPLAVGLIFAIGLVSLKENVKVFAFRTASISEKIQGIFAPKNISHFSFAISSLPHVAYEVSSQTTDLYSGSLQDAYIRLGNTLFASTRKATSYAIVFLKNPPLAVLDLTAHFAIKEAQTVDGVFVGAKNDVLSAHAKTFTFLSDSFSGVSDVKKSTKDFTASAGFAVERSTLTPVDRAGISLYKNINDFFSSKIYLPIASVFNQEPLIVITPASIQQKKSVAQTTTPNQNTSVQTRVVTVRSTPPQVIQNIVNTGVSGAELEARLEILNNNINAKLASLSTGTGGSVTNIYQQIANSQRIDQLNGTHITNATIEGGSINGASISGAPSISTSGNLSAGTTTLTALAVTGSATTTFGGGIDIAVGCFAINGVCFTGSGGVGTPSGPLNSLQFNSGGTFGGSAGLVWNDILGNLGIGTTSPYQKLSVAGNVLANSFIATSTATSTFVGGIQTNLLSVTSTTATSTFANGINVTGGCVLVDGTCLGTGSSGGITALGPTGQTQSGATQTLATSTSLSNGLTSSLTITASGNTQTFTSSLSGVLTAAGGGTGISTPTAAGVLIGDYAGTGYQQIATSSLGLLTTNVAEGSNLYYTDARVDTYVAASTTIPKLYTANTWTRLQSFAYSSSTIYSSFATASTTNLVINGSSFNSLLGSGLSNSVGTLTVSGLTTSNFASTNISQWTNNAGYVTYAWPFTASANYVSTTTTLGLLNGFFSTASSTISGPLRLTTLSDGGLAVFNGLVSSAATTTAGTGLTYSANAFNVNTTQNIAKLSNLTTNGFVKTSGSDGTLSVDTASYQPAGNYITALTGDVTASGPGSAATTLATVNSNVGSFGSSTAIPTFTVNAKGLITAASTNAVIAPAGTLTGATLAANVLSSSLTSVGTLSSLTVSGATTLQNTLSVSGLSSLAQASSTGLSAGFAYFGETATSTFSSTGALTLATALTQANGGTGISSYTPGDILYVNGGGTLSKLPVGSDGLVLKVVSGFPSWQTDISSGGGGGATAFSTSTNSMIIYPTDTSNIFVLGSNATTTTGNIFEVVGNTLFGGALRVTGQTTLAGASSTGLSAGFAYFGSTATSSFNSLGRLTLASLSAGGLAIDTNGLVYSAATTTAGTGLTYSGNAFNVNTTQNIAKLSNLTTNGFVKTSGSDGTLSVDTTTYQPSGTYLTGLGSGYATTTQTAVAFSTSTLSFNGLTFGNTVTATAGALTLTPTVTGTLANTGLANSTISGISLGANLANLTATDGTLTFSGSYNGGTARTIGLNLGNANVWTGLQSFAYSSSTIYSSFVTASTTDLIVNGSSFNNLLGSGLSNVGGALTVSSVPVSSLAALSPNSVVTTNSAGQLIATGTQLTVGNIIATTTANSYFLGNVGVGTSTPSQLLDVQKDQNSLTAIRVMNGTSNTFARSAIAVGASSDPFLLTIDAFSSAYGSSGSDDAQNGGRLLVSGAGGFAFRVTNPSASLRYYTGSIERMRVDSTGNIGIGTTTPGSLLSLGDTGNNTINISATATSTFGSGINIRTGCFSINGICTQPAGNYITALTGDVTASGPGSAATTLATVNSNVGSFGSSTAIPTFTVNAKGLITAASTNAVIAPAGTLTGATLAANVLSSSLTSVGTLSSLTVSGATTLQNTLSVSGLSSLAQASSTGLSAGFAYFGETATSTFTSAGFLGLGTSTPYYGLTIASSSASQLALSAGAGIAQWAFRNAGGDLFLSTTTVAGTATTTTATLSISGSGFGTTTVRGLNISGQATSTSNVGFNLSGGCFSISGTCIGAGVSPSIGGTLTSATAGSVLFADSGTFAQDNANFYFDDSTNHLGLGTTTPFAKLSINSIAGESAFVVGSSTATSFIVDKNGSVGVNTAAPSGRLTVRADSTDAAALVVDQGSSSNPWAIQFSRDGLSSAYVQLASSFGLSWQASLNPYSDNNSTYTLGTPSLRWNSLSVGTGASIFGGSVGLSSTLSVSGLSSLSNASSTLFSANQAWFGGTATTTITNAGWLGIATTTPSYALNSFSSTLPQLALSAGAGIAQWAFRNAGGNLYLSTTTVAGTATTSTSAFSVSGSGFGTTTLAGLTISGQATSTSNVGFNITTGCFAISSNCLSLSTLGGTLAVTNGGTGATSFAPNSIIVSNTAGTALIATGTQLTVGNIIATTTANSYFLGKVGIATTTPSYALNSFSSTLPQLALSAGAGIAQWAFRNAGGNLYLSTTTVAGTATTSTSAFSVSGSGFGTTTLAGLTISGQATSTSNVGFNITGGCFAISGTCVGGSSFSNTLANGGTATTTFYTGGVVFSDSSKLTQAAVASSFFWNNTNLRLGLGTSTPFAKLSVNNIAGEPGFAVGSSTATSFIVDKLGNVGVGTSTPTSSLTIQPLSGKDPFKITSSTGAPMFAIDQNGITTIDNVRSDYPINITNTYRGMKVDLTTPDSTSRGVLIHTAGTDGYLIDLEQDSGSFAGTGLFMNLGNASSFTGYFAYFQNNYVTKFSVGANGQTAIASTTPWGLLSVNPSALGSGVPEFVIGSSTATHFIVTGGGSVGIGTSSPSSTLTLQGGSINTVNLLSLATYSGATALSVSWYGGLTQNISSTTAIDIQNGSGVNVFRVDTVNKRLILATTTTPTLNNDGELAIGDGGTASTNGRIWIKSNGTTFRFQSDNNTADYSEFFYTNAATTAVLGSIMSVDTSTSSPASGTGVVKLAGRAYDNNILGVVSNQGTSFNNPDDTRQRDPHFANVGLLGHVRVLIASTSAPILVGDYITSSRMAGLGMKADRSGMVVGQALENYDPATASTTTSIMVLVKPGYQVVNNTFVLGEDDAQISTATSTGALAHADMAGFLINQKGSGNLLQLQQNGVDKFIVDNNGGLNILASVSNTVNLLNISNASSTVFAIDSVGGAKLVGHIAVGKDTAGTATIKTGDNQTAIVFAAPYALAPKIVVTINGVPAFGYGVINKTENGFTIATNKAVTEDTTFDWVAFVQPEENLSSSSSINLQVITVGAGNGGNNGGAGSTGTTTPGTDTFLPVITVVGDNPATVTVSSVYNDLGATVTDTDENGVVNDNLGLHYTVDGVDVSEITLDTTATSTHTIIYSATDGAGNVGTATRTVNVVQ